MARSLMLGDLSVLAYVEHQSLQLRNSGSAQTGILSFVLEGLPSNFQVTDTLEREDGLGHYLLEDGSGALSAEAASRVINEAVVVLANNASTADLLLEDESGHYLLEDGSGALNLESAIEFAGLVRNVKRQTHERGARVRYLIDCQDYTALASDNVVPIIGYPKTVLADSPVAYWRMDDSSAIADSSGNGNTGSPVGSGITYGAPGLLVNDPDKAISFDGTASGYFSVPTAAILHPGDVFSLEVWFQAASTGGFAHQFLYASAISDYSFWRGTTGKFVCEAISQPRMFETTGTWLDLLPHHVVATKDGGTFAMYVDGVSVPGTFANQTITASTGAIKIGVLPPSSNATFGTIDELAIYNYALTPAQVANHYLVGSTDGALGLVGSDRSRIVGLFSKYGTKQVETGNEVQTLVASMPPQDYVGKTLAECLNLITGISGGDWYVDYQKHLHTFLLESQIAPFGFSDAPDNIATFGYSGLELPSETTKIKNAVYLIPGGLPAVPTWYVDTTSVTLYGRHEASVSLPKITAQADLALAGAGYLAENAYPIQTGSLTCYQPGLLAGMTVKITNANHGLSAAAYRITAVDTKYRAQNAPEFKVDFGSPRRTLAMELAAMRSST